MREGIERGRIGIREQKKKKRGRKRKVESERKSLIRGETRESRTTEKKKRKEKKIINVAVWEFFYSINGKCE